MEAGKRGSGEEGKRGSGDSLLNRSPEESNICSN